MLILVKTFHQMVNVNVVEEMTIFQLKETLKDHVSVDSQRQRLIFNARELKDEETVGSIGITENSVIFLVLKLQGVTRVVIRTLDDREIVLDSKTDETIFNVKQKIEDKLALPISRQRLIARGKELQDHEMLLSHFSETEAASQIVLHLLVRPLNVTRKDMPAQSNVLAMNALQEKLKERAMKKEIVKMPFSPPNVLQTPTTEELLGDLMRLDETHDSSLFEGFFGAEGPADVMADDSSFTNSFSSNWSPSIATPPTAFNSPPTVQVKTEIFDHSTTTYFQPERSIPASRVTTTTAKAAPAGGRGRRVKVEMTEEERQQKRILKNRLSAERSRQKKLAYTEELEFKLSVSKSENSVLRDRVRELECSLVALSLMVKPNMLETAQQSILSTLQSLPVANS